MSTSNLYEVNVKRDIPNEELSNYGIDVPEYKEVSEYVISDDYTTIFEHYSEENINHISKYGKVVDLRKNVLYD